MKHLTDSRIETVVGVLDGWRGKLTWNLLIDKLEPLIGRYTRQALDRHQRIKDAYQARKEALSGREEGAVSATTQEIQLLLDRIEGLKAKNERLERENNALLEQFVRWAYNAHTQGISQEQLNAPLPGTDRGATG